MKDSSGGWLTVGSAVVELWDIVSNKVVRTLPGDSSRVSCVAFLPGGKMLASGGYDTRTIKIWNPETGGLLRNFQLPRESSKVISLTFSPDGKILAVGTEDKMIILIDMWSAKIFNVLEPDVEQLTELGWDIEGHDNLIRIHTLAFSPGGDFFAGANEMTINLWNTKNWERTRTIKSFEVYNNESVQSMAFSPDGKQIASGSSDGTIKLWDVSTGTKTNTIDYESQLKRLLLDIGRVRYRF